MSRKSFLYFPTIYLIIILPILTSCDRIPPPVLVATASSGVRPTPSSVFSTQPVLYAQGTLSDPYGHPVFHVGDIISAGYGILVVSGWEFLPDNEVLKPDPGNKFIAIEIVIVNLDSTAVSISGLLQITLQDDTSQFYNINYLATAMAEGGTIDGELSPGERVRGKLGFQIPENVQGLQLVFDATIFDVGKVYVDLGSEPVMSGTPPLIQGEFWQPAYYLGNTIVIGWLSITVNEVTYPAGNKVNPPSDGNKYLVVDLTLENKGAVSVNVSSLSQMWVKDATGRKFTIDLQTMTNLRLSSLDGDLAGEEKKYGQVGFQIPEDATNLVFVFDGDRFNTGKAFVIIPP